MESVDHVKDVALFESHLVVLRTLVVEMGPERIGELFKNGGKILENLKSNLFSKKERQ